MVFPLLIPLIQIAAGGALWGLAAAGSFLASAGLSLLIGGGLSAAGSLFSTSKGNAGFSSSPTYGFDNIGNNRGVGGPGPVVYGEHPITPQTVSTNLVYKDGGLIFRGLYVCSQGRCDTATTSAEWKTRVRINKIPAGQIPGVRAQFRPGTATQTAMEGFDEIGRPFNKNFKLDQGLNGPNDPKPVGEIHTIHAVETPSDGIKLYLVWSSGMLKRDSKGRGMFSAGGVMVEYKATGTTPGSKTTFATVDVIEPKITSAAAAAAIRAGQRPYIDLAENPDWSRDAVQENIRYKKDGWFWTRGMTTAAIRRLLVVRFPRKATYEIRMSGTFYDDDNDRRQPTLSAVIEFERSAETYANWALMGLDVPATEQTQGAEPDVEVLWRGRELWDPRQGGDPDNGPFAWTRSPGLAILDIYLNKLYGRGLRYSVPDIHVDSFKESATVGETQVFFKTGSTKKEALWELDLVVDTRSEARQWVDHIARTCRATVFPSEGQIKIVHDLAQIAVARHIEADPLKFGTRHNVRTSEVGVPDIRRSRVRRRPNLVRVKYRDRDEFWREATAEAPTSPQVGVTIAEIPLEMQVFGVSRESQARREAGYIRDKANLTPVLASVGVSYGDLDLEPGDMVTLSSAKHGWSAKKFLVLVPSYEPATGIGVLALQEYSDSVYPDGIYFTRSKGTVTWTDQYIFRDQSLLEEVSQSIKNLFSASKSTTPPPSPPQASASVKANVIRGGQGTLSGTFTSSGGQ